MQRQAINFVLHTEKIEKKIVAKKENKKHTKLRSVLEGFESTKVQSTGTRWWWWWDVKMKCKIAW